MTALPEPDVVAEDPGGSVTQAVGILLAAAAAFGVAAFSPLMVARLLPLAEAASVAQGVKGGPVRAAQTATSMAYSVQMLRDRRMRVVGGQSRSSIPGTRAARGGRRGGGAGGEGPGLSRGGRLSPGGSGAHAGAGPAGGASSSGGMASGGAAAAGPAGAAVSAGFGAAKRTVDSTKRAAQRAGETAERMAGGGADRSGEPGAWVGARRVPNREQDVPPHSGTVPARRRRPPGSTPSGGGDGR